MGLKKIGEVSLYPKYSHLSIKADKKKTNTQVDRYQGVR